MKIKTILVSLVILGFAATGVSQQNTIQANASTMQGDDIRAEPAKINLTQLQKQYNKNSEEIPGFMGSVIGDQTITVNLTKLETGSEILKDDIIGVKTNGVRTKDIQWGEYEEPTLKIWITQENVESLKDAENPGKKLNQMMKNDKIKYETYTFGNNIKFGIIELFSSLA